MLNPTPAAYYTEAIDRNRGEEVAKKFEAKAKEMENLNVSSD